MLRQAKKWSQTHFWYRREHVRKPEKDEPTTSDECFKMAYTDAVSVACKSLGFGADIYWQNDRTKYNSEPKPDVKQTPTDEEILNARNVVKR